MYTDAQLRPSNAQALTTGTQVSTDSIDLLSANRNVGRAGSMRAVVTVDVTFTGGTSLTPKLIESDNSDLSSPNVIATGPTVVEASLTAGAEIWDVAMPDNTKRYLGFQYVTVGTHTAGKVSAHIVANSDYNPYLPANTGRD